MQKNRTDAGLRAAYAQWRASTRAAGEWSTASIGTMGLDELAGLLLTTHGSVDAVLRAQANMPAAAREKFSPVVDLLLDALVFELAAAAESRDVAKLADALRIQSAAETLDRATGDLK